jgi:hypothetical protein
MAEIMNVHRDFFEFHKKKYHSCRSNASKAKNKAEMKDKAELL